MTTKTGPIPIKFKETEEAFLTALNQKTGISVAELVRRSVRHLRNSVNSAPTEETRSHIILQLHA